MINLLTKCKLIDEKVGIKQEDAIKVIEQYFAKGTRLEDKLSDDKFAKFYKENPLLLEVNREIDERRKHNAARKKKKDDYERFIKNLMETDSEAAGKQPPLELEQEEAELDDETRRTREEKELAELKEKWLKDTFSNHLIYVKGVEIVFFEFKEILLRFAVILREKIDPKTGKLKVIVTKFIEDWILPRLQSFVKFRIPTTKLKADASRSWPESNKDLEIKAMKLEKQKLKLEQQKKEEELARQKGEISLMLNEDTPALDFKEIEERRRKMIEEEEAQRRAKEAMEEVEDEEEESSNPEDDGSMNEDDEDY